MKQNLFIKTMHKLIKIVKLLYKEFLRVLFDALEESMKNTPQEAFIRNLFEGLHYTFL